MEIEDGETPEGVLPKASTKKKPPKPEESRSKKEHVNVVFIGHVGESSN
jgi:peptide chain release factor subunit 3